MISPAEPLCVNSDVIACEVTDGEAVIINLSNGMYYTMDKVGAEVWQLIEGRRSVHQIAAEIAARYGMDRDGVLGDLETVVAELVSEDLVLAGQGNATSDEPRVELPAPMAPYTKPAVTRYTNLNEVLALDPPLPKLGAGPGSKA